MACVSHPRSTYANASNRPRTNQTLTNRIPLSLSVRVVFFVTIVLNAEIGKTVNGRLSPVLVLYKHLAPLLSLVATAILAGEM